MIICFDMDGTIANLYSVDNWLMKLRAEDASPYLEAEPLWDMVALGNILRKLQAEGHEIQVISWLSKDSSASYKAEVREAKREWLTRYNFPMNHFHGVAYGATKADSIRRTLTAEIEAILIDDNEKVRNGWHLGRTIDPTSCDLLQELASLL